MKRRALFLLTFALIILVPLSLQAYVSSSTNYQLERDSLNSGGFDSTSTSYGLQDTVGEVATGFSTSTSYNLSAGYWIPDDVFISISSTGDVVLGSLNGLTGGTVTGSSTYLVTTNNAVGYQLTVRSETSPALKASLLAIPDYVTASSDPDFSFSIGTSTSMFGFTPEGADIEAAFKDNGSSCNFGTSDTANACWKGFSTTPSVIASSALANIPYGSTTTIKYRVDIRSGGIQESADGYSASIVVTATTL